MVMMMMMMEGLNGFVECHEMCRWWWLKTFLVWESGLGLGDYGLKGDFIGRRGMSEGRMGFVVGWGSQGDTEVGSASVRTFSWFQMGNRGCPAMTAPSPLEA